MQVLRKAGGSMGNNICIVLVLALVFVQQIAVEGLFLKNAKKAKSVEVIDSNQDVNIEKIAYEVCRTIPSSTSKNYAPKEISRISTINKLALFFESINERHWFSECARYSLAPLRKLRELLSLGNENVCSAKKISLLKNYHEEFISTAFEHVAGRRNEELKTPYMIRTFFMNYALELSAICRKSLLSNIYWDVYNGFSEADYRFTNLDGILGNILSKLTIYVHPIQRVDDFDDLFISWHANIITMLDYTDNNNQDEVNSLTGELIKLRMKVNHLGPIQHAQKKCRHEFKPIYTKLLVPILELANLGYAWTGDRLERESEELRSSKLANSWYDVAQVCEAILPIKFYQDKTLGSDSVEVISADEAKRLVQLQSQLVEVDAGVQPIKRLFYEPVTNSMEGIDKLDWVGSEEAQRLVRQIKLDISQEERATDRAMAQIARNIRLSRN